MKLGRELTSHACVDDPTQLALWGKAHAPDGSHHQTHPLIYHCLDVAAVAQQLMLTDEQLQKRIANRFSAPFSAIYQPILALIAIHDTGKATRQFQSKAAFAWPEHLGERPESVTFDHADAGAQLLNGKCASAVAQLFEQLEPEPRAALIYATTYHHGQPLDRHPNNGTKLSWGDERIAAQIVTTLINVVNPDGVSFPPITEADANALSWLLSGLVNLADWVGSNTDYFPYAAATYSPDEYWEQIAQPRAIAAIDALRLAPQPINDTATWETMFPGWEPSPLQSMCAEMVLPDGPSLTIIEDATGAGKTEAALILAARLMQKHRSRGVFIALPTMATTNALYSRMAQKYRALYTTDADPSLVLAHGRAGLHDEFRASVWGGGGPSSCQAFFADNRKCGSLADVGVGTIDQALMSVLPTRHATLRQFGASRQVLIIDEAHAYDAYMSREMERLIEFHAAAGGSVVVLSATLPQRLKERLASAYSGERVELNGGSYPLITVVGS